MSSEVRVTGQLRIVVLKARHLQNRRKLEKQNPYVTLRIGHIVETTKVDYRGGQTPSWDDETKFELTPDLEPVLQLSILDETKKTPTLIAEKRIDITPAFSRPPDIGYDSWYRVEYGGKEAGEIFLEMTFYPTAPKVPLKIPIRNRLTVGRASGSSRPLPMIPGQEGASEILVSSPYAEDVLFKSFSSSQLHKKLPTKPLPEPIPLEDRRNERLPISKTESNISNKLAGDLDGLFIGSEDENPRRNSEEFKGLKRFTNKFQTLDTPHHTTNNFLKKLPFTTSPKKSFFSRFGIQQQQQSNEDDFDLLEQQVQSDWEKNHPNEFQEAINRRFGEKGKKNEEEDEDKTSSWTRSISSLNKNSSEIPIYFNNDSESDDEAPLPPPKSNNSSRSGNSLFSSHRSAESTDYAHLLDKHNEKFKQNASPKQRKPPPHPSASYSSRFSDLDIDIPYSAESIGSPNAAENPASLKTTRVPKLPKGKREDEVFQSKYIAPTPDEHLARKMRLEAGVIRDGDLAIDPGMSGYKGSGEWAELENARTSYSPSRFNSPSRGVKPKVPAKVPIGLSDEEYFVIDKERYLRDLNGRRG